MAKSEVDLVTDKVVANRGILAKLYFDMHSATQEELQPVMTELVNNRILKSKGVVYCFGSIDEPLKVKDEFSTSAELTILFNDLDSMVNVVFSFSPIAIEILRPKGEYVMRTQDLQSSMLTLSEISMKYSEYILREVLSPEDLEKVKSDMKSREEVGKRLMQKKPDQS